MEAVQIKTARPPVYQSLLKILIAIGTGISLLLGLLEYKDLVPNDWMAGELAVWVGAASGILFALKQFCEAIGDVLDDGIVNKSFKLMLLVGLLPWCLTSCGSVQELSDTKLMLAKAGVQTAQIAFAAAGTVFLERLNDPDTPAWQVQAASKALDMAAKQLGDAEARYAREQARRDALENAPALTGGKTALSVVP